MLLFSPAQYSCLPFFPSISFSPHHFNFEFCLPEQHYLPRQAQGAACFLPVVVVKVTLPCGGFFGWFIFNSEQPISASLSCHHVRTRQGLREQTNKPFALDFFIFLLLFLLWFFLFLFFILFLELLGLCGWVAPGRSPAAINSLVYKQ